MEICINMNSININNCYSCTNLFFILFYLNPQKEKDDEEGMERKKKIEN